MDKFFFVKMTFFLCAKKFCGPRWTGGVRNGTFEGDPALMFFTSPFSCFPFFVFSLKKCVFFSSYSFFLSNMFTTGICIRVQLWIVPP